jgi:hypothetical protein
MITSLVCFYLHNVLYEEKLKISEVYSLIVIFSWISYPVRNAIHCLNRRVQAYTTGSRLGKLARLPETLSTSDYFSKDSSLEKGEIVIENGNFVWEDPQIKKIFEEFKAKDSKDGKESSAEDIELKNLNSVPV